MALAERGRPAGCHDGPIETLKKTWAIPLGWMAPANASGIGAEETAA